MLVGDIGLIAGAVVILVKPTLTLVLVQIGQAYTYLSAGADWSSLHLPECCIGDIGEAYTYLSVGVVILVKPTLT